MTVYIMAPVGTEMYRVSEVEMLSKGGNLLSSETVGRLLEAIDRSKEPLRDFLLKKVKIKDRAGLERAACECYEVVRRERARLMENGQAH